MKVIVAGTRTADSYDAVVDAITASGFTITELVCGMAQGVDTFGRMWAMANGIPVKEFPADWLKYGKAAGPMRNRQMAEYAEALVLVWDGKSRGSKNMLEEATRRGLKVFCATL